MNQLKHIMFDLDGTLLALDFNEFVEVYFKLIGKKLTELGHDPEKTVKCVWKGTGAMVMNDGSITNEEAFWSVFTALMEDSRQHMEALLEKFYRNEFHEIRKVLREERNLRPMIDALKEKGYTLSLATNPVFPKVGVESRLAWLGLTAEDFDVVTSYENCSYCKPQLGYYERVLELAGVTAEESLMVGNNIYDDMPAAKLGTQVYLVTDLLENPENGSVDDYPHGTFKELQEYLESLPAIK